MPISSRATLPKSGKKGPRKSSSLPAETVEYLKAWMMSPEHIAHPYPTEPEKAQIMADTGIELKQLTNWFVNNRKRYWKPRVEARLQQQARAAAAAAQAHAVAVATVSVHSTNPVSPEQGFKPTLTVPGNGFVTFDLGSPARLPSPSTTKQSYPHLVETTDMTRVLRRNPYERIVSETSSSASVTASEEGNVSDATSTSQEEVLSIKTTTSTSAEQQQEEEMEDQDYNSSQQPSGESSSSVSSIPSTSANVSLSEDSSSVMGPIKKKKKREHHQATVFSESPRKKFRRVSIELWRETCQNARNVYNDEALPSLEEATQLFGYGQ